MNSIESDTGGQNNGVNWSAVEVNGRLLVDGNPGVGKTLTRFRAKTDWNWHRISAVKVNGQLLTTGTLDNTGNVWTDPDEWKDGNADSSNATYSQSARGDWFDVTLSSGIANFSELQFFMQLDSSAGSTTNVYEIELFYSDGTSYLRTYASNSDAPNQANAAFNSWQWQNFGDLGISVPSVPSVATTVRARPEVGFSIVKFTSPSGSDLESIAHGLNKEPSLIINKGLSAVNWQVFTNATGSNHTLTLNSTAAQVAASSSNYAQDDFTFSLKNGHYMSPGQEMVNFIFSPIEGYSSIGSYEGNGQNSDGPVVICGFEPRLIMIKNVDNYGSGYDWFIFDTERSQGNVTADILKPNLPAGEYSFNSIDILSNGFKIRRNTNGINLNQHTHLYIAFASNPFASQTRAR